MEFRQALICFFPSAFKIAQARIICKPCSGFSCLNRVWAHRLLFLATLSYLPCKTENPCDLKALATGLGENVQNSISL